MSKVCNLFWRHRSERDGTFRRHGELQLTATHEVISARLIQDLDSYLGGLRLESEEVDRYYPAGFQPRFWVYVKVLGYPSSVFGRKGDRCLRGGEGRGG